jgi:hypothetical protein
VKSTIKALARRSIGEIQDRTEAAIGILVFRAPVR